MNIEAMINVSFNIFGLVYNEFLPTGQIVNLVYYKQVLERFKEKVHHKSPEARKSKP